MDAAGGSAFLLSASNVLVVKRSICHPFTCMPCHLFTFIDILTQLLLLTYTASLVFFLQTSFKVYQLDSFSEMQSAQS